MFILFFQKNFSPLFGAANRLGQKVREMRKNSLINTRTRIRRYLMMVRKTPFAALFDIKGLIQEEERKRIYSLQQQIIKNSN